MMKFQAWIFTQVNAELFIEIWHIYSNDSTSVGNISNDVHNLFHSWSKVDDDNNNPW